MATIDPKLMEAILAKSNWTMTSFVDERIFGSAELFLPPKPPPRPALVVPVDVQALYVPRNHSERYVRLPMALGGPERDDGPEATRPFATPRARPAGVHLHWALPDGLLRGEMQDDPDQPIAMRPLPNRWLVLRLIGPKNQKTIALRGWVIESDRGKLFDLDDYPDGDAKGDGVELAPEALDGLAGGSPSWTAAYDASRNRFAFHDRLSGIDPNRIATRLASYVVIGWWSERTHEPLPTSLSPFSVSRRLERFGWSASTAPRVPNAPTVVFALGGGQPFVQTAEPVRKQKAQVDISGQLKHGVSQQVLTGGFAEYDFDPISIYPLRTSYDTLMHGAVYGVPITGGIGRDAAPRASAIGLSMAPTIERLMAAQAAKGRKVTTKPKREYFESLFTAIANGSITRLGEPDGIIALDEAEHGDGFEAFRGPDTYEDVVIERSQNDLKAGRKERTRRAAAASGRPPKAQLIWAGKGTGKTKASDDELRQTTQEEIDKAFKRAGREDQRPTIRRIPRPGPRYHRAVPPVIGLRDFGKANRFHGDGRFDEDGRLSCRWTTELSFKIDDGYKAEDYLPTVDNPALPEQTMLLLEDSYLLDPYIATWAMEAIPLVVQGAMVGLVQSRLQGELALRYSADGVYDGFAPIARGDIDTPKVTSAMLSEELRRFSIMEGRDPSPVGITNWMQPWAPVWLEWEVELEPGDDLAGWALGRIDFEGDSVPAAAPISLRGRSPITTGLARNYQAVIDDYLIAEAQRDKAGEGEITAGHQHRLAGLSDFLKNNDLGSVTLDQVRDLWLAVGSGPDGQELPVPETVADNLAEAGLPRLIRSGRLHLSRARIIDSFGRFRNLSTDKVTLPAALDTKDGKGRKALALPPRLALPARLMWRFVDPAQIRPDPTEARLDQADPAKTVSPIAGYVLPDFIDESIEFFDANGEPLGEVLHDPVTGGLTWEGGVGRDGPAATLPEEGLAPAARLCGRIASGMIDADAAQRADPLTRGLESPLSAFLRAVDTTMWGIDSALASSSATIAGLVGRPVAVVSTLLWLDIPKELSATGAFGEHADALRDFLIEHAVYDAVKSKAFDIRLGEFAKGHDGLYGYFIGNDFSRFNLIEKSVTTAARSNRLGEGFRTILGGIGKQIDDSALPVPDPIKSAYITESEPVSLHAGQKIRLTLLMHPTARVHATSGVLPRKSLELLRDWVMPGLGRIAPSARIGPVLIDPDKVRLPKIAAFGARQSWTRRDSPVTWRDDPILSATQAALLPEGPVTVEEGYIRIAPDGGEDDGGDV